MRWVSETAWFALTCELTCGFVLQAHYKNAVADAELAKLRAKVSQLIAVPLLFNFLCLFTGTVLKMGEL